MDRNEDKIEHDSDHHEKRFTIIGIDPSLTSVMIR